MAFGNTQTIIPAAAYTASGNGPSSVWDGSPGEWLTVLVAVTAVSGTTPTLDLKVQWSFDGVAFSDAETPDSFTQIIGVKSVVKQFTAKGPFYRIVYTVAGTTPSFTFSASTYVTD